METKSLDVGRLALAGAAVALVSVIGNIIIALLFQALFAIPPEFEPFEMPRYIFLSVLGAVGATLVYGYLVRSGPNPTARFNRIAVIVLILSFIPDIAMLFTDFFPGATVPGVIALMLMHVVAAAASMALLPRLS